MSEQNWEPIVLKKKSAVKKSTIKKPVSTTTIQNSLLDDSEHVTIKYVDKELSQEIIKARVAKGLKRTDLAKQLNLQESIIADYENGTAVHNGPIIAKIKRYLGLHK